MLFAALLVHIEEAYKKNFQRCTSLKVSSKLKSKAAFMVVHKFAQGLGIVKGPQKGHGSTFFLLLRFVSLFLGASI